MVMYDHDNELRKKGNKIYPKDKIKPQQIHQHVHFPLTGIPPCMHIVNHRPGSVFVFRSVNLIQAGGKESLL